MNEYNIDDDIFDAICKAAFSQYIIDKCKTYPSKEETDAMFTISKRGRRRLKRALKAKEYGKPLFVVYFQRVAIVLLVTIAVAFCTIITNTEVRAAIKNVIIEWYDEYIKFDFIEERNETVEIDQPNKEENKGIRDTTSNPLYDYKIGYIPSGFELENISEMEFMRNYVYYNSFGKGISISISLPSYSTYAVDIENNKYIEMILDDRNVHFFYDDYLNTGSILCDDSGFIIYVYGDLNKQELIKIFKNIKKL